MIHFMIDFENVRSAGLQGSEYLCMDDSVTIFYSTCCSGIEQDKIRHILESGCELDICKLQNTGKNALDFYIASRIGEIYGGGYEGDVAIVSRDKGFKAVQEYWRKADSARNVVLKPDMEQCIVSSGENSERSAVIREKRKIVNLEGEFEKYKARKAVQEEIKQLFADSKYGTEIGKIIDMVQQKPTPKVLYLDTLKRFGRKQGLEIYSKIRDVG